MITLAISPASPADAYTGTWTVSKHTPYEFDTTKALTATLARIDSTHYLFAYTGDGDDGWAVMLVVDPATWQITRGTPFEFDTVKGKESDLIQIDNSHYLCAYSGDGDDGWAVVLVAGTDEILP